MLVFHPAGECHAEEHHSTVASLNVELGSTWMRRVSELVAPLDRPAEFGGDGVAAAGLELLRELRRDDADSALAIEGLTLEILAASAKRRETVDRTAPRWLREARELLEAQPRSASLRSVAEQAGVHPVHFAATFRRFFGCSLGEFQRRRRFELARRKLADPGISLAQCAADAGFADQSHMTRTFKRFSGMTPGDYRSFLAFKTRGQQEDIQA
jgi:AraC family transcriptional regulator